MGLVLALLVLYVSYVPAAKKTFDEYGVTLPLMTQAVIRVSNWLAGYWWALVPVLLLFGAADFGLLGLLRTRGRFTAVKWVVFFSLVLGLLFAITAVAIELPRAKIRDALAR
jgi:type II secretory pathway component PulF